MSGVHWKGLGSAAVLAAALGWSSAHAAQYLDGQLRVSGFVRAQAAINTSENVNPANTVIPGVTPPAFAGLKNDPDLNLFRIWGLVDLDYRPRTARGGLFDEFRLFTRARAIYDGTQDVSGGVSDYDAFPQTNQFADSATMLRANTDTFAAELWEVFADMRKGPLWMRIGKQNVVWGEATATRLLDIVNPLDISWHPFEGGGELFDHQRIPLWMIRATYDLPFWGLSLDAFVNPGDFVPQLPGPDVGSPWNFLPPQVRALIAADNTDDRRGDTQWGVRLLGSVKGVNWTLNYLRIIDSAGVIFAQSVTPIFAPPPAPPGPPVAIIPTLVKRHDYLSVLGGSFNWYWDRFGVVFRGELTYTFDQAFPRAATRFQPPGVFPFGVDRRDAVRWLIGIDRPTFVISKSRAMLITFEVAHENIEDGNVLVDEPGGGNLRRSKTALTLFLSQPFMNDQFFVEFLGVYDTKNAYWWQPQVRWQPGNNWRVWAYYNAIGGSEERTLPISPQGPYDHMDEFNIAVSYQF